MVNSPLHSETVVIMKNKMAADLNILERMPSTW